MKKGSFKRLAVLGASFGLLASPVLIAPSFAHEHGQSSAMMQLAAKGKKKDKKPQPPMELASKSVGGRRGRGHRKLQSTMELASKSVGGRRGRGHRH